MKFSVYATFEQMHGRKSSLAELVEGLQRFSRESVLYTCAVTGMVLKLWDGTNWDRTNYDLFISSSFDQLRGDWYLLSERLKGELVVHRRQLMLIMKLALEHCQPGAADLLSAPPGYFGTILLMANDQFHYGLYPPPKQGRSDERDKVLRVLAEFIPVTEYAGSRIENRIVRSHLMMTKYRDLLADHPDFVDVASVYEGLTGVSLEDHEVLTFALFSRCNMVTLAGLQQNAWLAAVREKNFHTTAVPHETIHAYFSELAASSVELKREIQEARNRNCDHGANDFTVFRRKPLVVEKYGMLPTDVELVIEKFETGPYWRVNDTSRQTGDKLRRFSGAVFEAYANDQLQAAVARSNALFIPDPRWADDDSAQVSDGILIEGDALILLEYKANMFTARAKYSGDHVLLRDEIATKLVRNDLENKRKGVEQLANAVQRLLGGGSAGLIKGLDLARVSRIYPLLVTLDTLGGTLLMSRLLNGYFSEFLVAISSPQEKTPQLFCTDIESLEQVLPFLDVYPLNRFLQHWLESDPTLMATLLAHPPDGLPNRRNDMLYTEWKKLSELIESRLFPEEHAAHRQKH